MTFFCLKGKRAPVSLWVFFWTRYNFVASWKVVNAKELPVNGSKLPDPCGGQDLYSN